MNGGGEGGGLSQCAGSGGFIVQYYIYFSTHEISFVTTTRQLNRSMANDIDLADLLTTLFDLFIYY